MEDRVTVITPSALSFTDTETPSNKLVYNVTKPLTAGQGNSGMSSSCITGVYGYVWDLPVCLYATNNSVQSGARGSILALCSYLLAHPARSKSSLLWSDA